MNETQTKSRTGRLMVTALLLMTAGLTTASTNDDTAQLEVTAWFEDADPLIPGNTIRAAGVVVGVIDDIGLEDGLARVDMVISGAVLPLYEDATATIVTENLLGERFIAIEQGEPGGQVLGEPAVLSTEQTSRVVDLQEVLDAVDAPTSQALAAIVTTLGEGIDLRGEDVDLAIGALQPSLEQTTELAAILSEQNQLLSSLIDNARGPAGAVASDRGADLDRLIGSANESMQTVARNREALERTLTQLPSTLAQARRSLEQVAGVADSTADTLESLRPVTDDLGLIDGELRRFADVADPGLAALVPVLERGEELLAAARPVAAELRASGDDIDSVAGSLRTLSDEALSRRLTNLMEFVAGWSMATTDYDAVSHYFKASLPVTPKALGQTAGGPVPGLEEPVPTIDALPEGLDLPLPGRDEDGKQVLPDLGGLGSSGASQDDDGATGLNEEQERNLVGQILGGLG